MAKGPDDTTDKLFPHQMVPESQVVERPVPLAPSIRQEFAEHRVFVEDSLKAFDARLGAALARLSPVPSVGGAFRHALPVAGRVGAIVGASLALAEVVVPLVAPELVGPLKALREAFGGPQ